MTGPWHAVDGEGRDLATGRPPAGPGRRSPAAALVAAPVMTWPPAVVGEDGGRFDLAAALGPGGDRVTQLLGEVAAGQAVDVGTLAQVTPGGRVELPVAVVGLGAAVEAAGRVDGRWLAGVDRRRQSSRLALVDAGRETALEAALHVAMLLATEWFDPADDVDVDAHVASGARLWLLTGAVVSALTGTAPDPFRAWGRLVAGGWWPVGPSDGRLVLSRPA